MTDYQAESEDLITLRDVLRWATSKFNEAGLFYGHGNDDAFNDAMQLILHCLHLPVTEFPELFIDCRITATEKQKIIELLEKRIEQRVPVPYLTQQAWFAGLPFYVDERVLIPRSPYAELIEEQFQPWLQSTDDVTSILDMCTGSGCIAIALAYAFAQAHVDAIDVSSEALAVAEVNIRQHQMDDQVSLIQSDVWSSIEAHQQYDLIISNPPYVGHDEMMTIPDEYRHEPKLALEANDDGLAIVEQILLKAADYLTEAGLLFVEVGNSDITVEARWPDIPFTWLEMANGGHGIFMLDKPGCQLFSEKYKA